MKRAIWIATTAALAIWLTGCEQRKQLPAGPDLKAEEAKIAEVDAAYMKAMQGRDAAAVAAIFTEDGTSHPSGQPMATGRAAVQKSTEQFFKTPMTSLSWKNNKIVVSEAADIAYSMGTYETMLKDAKGKPARETGKFVTVWKKQADGSWKVAEDISNADGPPTPVK